jgi:hypothetical protein
MERACLLTLYAERFANMTKMNAPAKAAKKVCPRAAADGQKRWQYWRKAVAEETSKFPKSNTHVTQIFAMKVNGELRTQLKSNAPQLLTDATLFQAAWPAAGTE